MIQINLLPDVKLEYIKARRLKRTVISVCILVSAVAFAVFALIFVSVTVVQKKHLSNLETDIQSQTKQLESMQNITKILTVQNQLDSLTGMHKEKPVASRVFTYIKQLAPTEASINTLTVNFDETSMVISGNAVNLASVNKFADTLKFTQYTAGANEENQLALAFSEVTLSEFGISNSGTNGKPASYSITLKYNPEIFSSASDIKLTIPNQITTRSETEKPQNVFEQPAQTEGGQ